MTWLEVIGVGVFGMRFYLDLICIGKLKSIHLTLRLAVSLILSTVEKLVFIVQKKCGIVCLKNSAIARITS
jgi:hypothetical protein